MAQKTTIKKGTNQPELSFLVDPSVTDYSVLPMTYPYSLPTLVEDSFREATVTDPNWRIGVGTAVNPTSPPQQPFLTAGSSQSGIIPGSPGGPLDVPGNGALRLTNSLLDQSSFLLYDSPINTTAGLTVMFDFYAYGGTGADGINFFLVDGRSAPTQAGALGGSLGYAQKNGIAPGIAGGYLGIGFDEFGNFSSPTDYPGGVTLRTGGPGQIPDSIAIRAGQRTDYQFIAGTTSLPFSIDNPTATTRDSAKRTAKIDLTPEGLLSVRIDGNNDGDFLDPGETSPNLIDINVADINGITLPRTLKFGFASGTGDFTNIHEIRNLVVSTLNHDPVAIDFTRQVAPSRTNLLSGFSAIDPDMAEGDSIASYSISTLPSVSQGVLYLGNPAQGGQPITIGTTLTSVQIQTVHFLVTAEFTGSSFSYTATDSHGASDVTPATVTLSPTLTLPIRENLTPDTQPSLVKLPQNTVVLVPVFDSGVKSFGCKQGKHKKDNNGDNQIKGTPNLEWLLGQGGNDRLSGLGCNDLLQGGRGNDRLLGGAARDRLLGERGNDDLSGNGGDDLLNLGFGNDRGRGDNGNDSLTGRRGNDMLQGGHGHDKLQGGRGNDQINGGTNQDNVNGQQNNDNLQGDKGQDSLNGGLGADHLRGGTQNDHIRGGRGNDVIWGGKGRDLLIGNRGDDRLAGNGQRDSLNGGLGNDLLIGGAGNDQLRTGTGSDRILYKAAEHGIDTILDFDAALDRIDLRQIFDGAGYEQANPFLAYVRLGHRSEGPVLSVDANGDALGGFVTLAVLKNDTSSSLSVRNFLL